ncbi:MAG: CDP-alcohol phosphatidyltransferase family protein [Acidimicrobiia bacterium]
MTETEPSDRTLTVPNLVTFLRLALIPLFWWLLLGAEEVAWAAALMFVVGWTDWIDGYLARRLGQVSKLGTRLDPVADRLMIGSALIGGLIAGVIPAVIGFALIAREAFMALLTLVLVTRGGGMLAVRYWGKVATFILYGAIPAFYLAAAGVVEVVTGRLAWLTGVVGLILYWFAALQYVGDARKQLKDVESPGSR